MLLAACDLDGLPSSKVFLALSWVSITGDMGVIGMMGVSLDVAVSLCVVDGSR
jgi:hypothetical protein